MEIKGARGSHELQVIEASSIRAIAKDQAAIATLRGKMIADKDISSLISASMLLMALYICLV